MAKQIAHAVMHCFLLLLLTGVAVATARGIAQGPEAVDEWFSKLGGAKKKVTKLHFYIHDSVSGRNPTAVTVARANTTSTSPTLFGLVNVADDPLTVGPEPNSTIVGRAQGIYSCADLSEIGLIMYMNFCFTAGEYKGSTLNMLGRDVELYNVDEFSIVGGTGVFRLARGLVMGVKPPKIKFILDLLPKLNEYSGE
ncbi:dirigent protein 23-like [Coffea arabica]|uniref:Dirigent protein n=1 Tax=Coffea arabica TaxID=13443 RepID=A0A6P6VLL5_COFAR|nr:dirigent protein 23-like [Coffea arabica]